MSRDLSPSYLDVHGKKTCKTFRFLKRRHILSNRVNDLEGRFAVGAISAVLSSPFYVPPAGKELGLLS